MKNVIVTGMLLLVVFVSFGQVKQDDQQLYKSKVESYTKLKRTGSTLGFVGAGVTVASIILVASADWDKSTNYDGTTQYNTTDGSGAIGIAGLLIGVPMTVTGIILNSVGNRKVKYYQEKLDNVKITSFHQGQQNGITLAIRF